MKTLTTNQYAQVSGGFASYTITKKLSQDNDRLRNENRRLKKELRNARKKDPKVRAHKERNTPQGT